MGNPLIIINRKISCYSTEQRNLGGFEFSTVCSLFQGILLLDIPFHIIHV